MGVIIFNNGKSTTKNSTGGSYDGEKAMGSLNNWRILTSDSNDILSNSYGLLSERSTTLYHTYAPVRGAVNKQVDYGIGDGLIFRSQPDYNQLGWDKEYAISWAKEFQKIIDYYYRKFNFYENQSVLFRSALYAGDSYLFFERKDGLLTDIIETQNNQVDWRYNQTGYTLGIKHDKWLRREGIAKTDGTKLDFKDENGDQNVVQFYLKELARQLRGYPLAYSIINLARNDDTHMDAVTHRAVMEAILIGSFESNGTNLAEQAKNLATANRKKKGISFNPLKNIANASDVGAGNIVTTNVGEKITFTDLKSPGNTFGPFKEWVWNYVAAATGTPPEVIMSKYSTSFTAHKGALNDFIKSYTRKRKTFERTVMDVVNREIAKDAIIQGYIKAPGFFNGSPLIKDAYLRGMYLGPVPGHINPLVEVKAGIEAVKGGTKLRSDIATMNGYEWDSFINEWTKEQLEFTAAPQDYQAEKVFEQENNQDDNNGGSDE